VLAATGCVSMPSGGPVLPSSVTQGTDTQNQPYVQIQPQPPGANWSPKEIVQGFLTASASYGTYPQVAKEYLTPTEQQAWNPLWSAVVYKSGPDATERGAPPTAKDATATVGIAGTIQASLQGNGTYSVPSSTPGSVEPPQSFTLAKVGGQWRISSAPPELLLTSDSFNNDYQLRNLYFFDPMTKFLVPDPVYVPVLNNSGVLMVGLVNELISPPGDWLSNGATKTAFPPKTNVSSVTLDGVTAVVNLTGAAIGKAEANNATMEQISAQLLWTLAPSDSNGQGVQPVEVVVNGKQWIPPDGQNNPVQHTPGWKPAYGGAKEFYYVASNGYLTSCSTNGGKLTSVAKIGTGYSQIAISQDGEYLAALRDSTLYTGLIDGPLTKRGTGFTAMSWDPSDDLWASLGTQIDMFRGTTDSRQPLGQVTQVDVGLPITGLQIAPDGVRVALVINGNELTFGAISWPSKQHPRISLSQIVEAPSTQGQSVSASVGFKALTWYGPDYVITLAEPTAGTGATTGPFVTEYPVSGGASTPIQAVAHMDTIAASWGQPLIAGLTKGGMMTDPSITGSWTPVNNGNTPAKGNSPTYPG
jgi:Lipoprotein LpqB beta-propeller domain/Sporulation and spore germination